MTSETEQLYQQVHTALETEDADALNALLSDMHAADIAEIYESLDDEEQSRLLFALPPSVTAEVIVEVDEAHRGEMVEDLNDRELTQLTSRMDPDDAADVLGELPEEQREQILDRIAEEQADKIKELLTYEEDTAGGIMTTELVSLPATATVREAVEAIRRSKLRDLHNVYVVDEASKLVGVVPLRQLVLNDKDTRLGRICVPDPITVNVEDDQEKVIHVISKYDCVSVPVVDDVGHLLGRITHDDVMDVFEEEADEDIYRMVGIDAAEFETASIFRAAGIRLSWLVPCLASMAITAAVMMVSQNWFDQLAVYASLVVFVPMIGAIGGNCGIQISTVIVRGLATGDLASSRFRTAFGRESRIALLMAPACGLAAFLISWVGLPVLRGLSHGGAGEGPLPSLTVGVARVAFAVGTGMACAILIAAMLGMILPFLFRRVGVDPAIASGPIVTTVNDIASVTTFLGLASLIIAH